MSSDGWTIDLLTTWKEIEAPDFLAWWKDLAERASNAHVFFHPVLVGVWLETYRPLRDIKPLFVRATKSEQQVLFPLMLWRRNWKNGWLRDVVPAGHSDFDYHDPLFLLPPEQEDIDKFYTDLRAKLDQSVDYDRLLLDGLHKQYLPPYMRVIRQDVCLSWRLSEMKWIEGLVMPKKASQGRELRRRYRRLQELGDLRFQKFAASELHAAQVSFRRMLEIHSKRWPHAYKAPDFHYRLLEHGVPAGLVNFVELSLNARPIAWQLYFSYKGSMSFYMPAIDSEFLPYGTGHLSLSLALANAAADDIAIADHLRGGEDYKSAWGGQETLVYDVVLKRTTLSSRLRLGLHSLLRLVKLVLKGQSK
jgi:CelD/BcsL family acetyltransferase involved in cellulose biosynthesis